MNRSLRSLATLERGRESYTLKDGTSGITLVALMVTIIVLLILAMVSVSLVIRGNIIEKANLAKSEYEKAAINETEGLNNLEKELLGNSDDNTDDPSTGPQKNEYGFYNDIVYANGDITGTYTAFMVFTDEGYYMGNYNE